MFSERRTMRSEAHKWFFHVFRLTLPHHCQARLLRVNQRRWWVISHPSWTAWEGKHSSRRCGPLPVVFCLESSSCPYRYMYLAPLFIWHVWWRMCTQMPGKKWKWERWSRKTIQWSYDLYVHCFSGNSGRHTATGAFWAGGGRCRGSTLGACSRRTSRRRECRVRSFRQKHWHWEIDDGIERPSSFSLNFSISCWLKSTHAAQWGKWFLGWHLFCIVSHAALNSRFRALNAKAHQQSTGLKTSWIRMLLGLS